MINQKVSITENQLEELKKLPGVKMKLPLNDETSSYLQKLIGKAYTSKWKSGIYIFTHLPSGSKYVGSSNCLSRRLNQYLTLKHINQKNSGLLLPLINKDGFDKFSLEIFVMPREFSSDFFYLFLEQYYLLHKEFNLNTQRIVNFRVNQGKKTYLYDLQEKILFYTSRSLNQINSELGIHFNTCNNCIKNGNNYLNFFKISNTLIKSAVNINLDINLITNLILEKRKLFKISELKKKVSLPISLKNVKTEENLHFNSITDTVKYLKSINIIVDRNTASKYLDTGKSYKGYLYNKTINS